MNKRSRSRATQSSLSHAWKRGLAVLRAHRSRLLRRKGVIGVDLGLKRSEGRLLDQLSLRIHVDEKIPVENLPKRRRFPDRLDGVAVDVVESRFRSGQACPDEGLPNRARLDPLVGGCAVGRIGEAAFGTLGAIATDAAGSFGGISCAHVCPSGDQVSQPNEWGDLVGSVTVDFRDGTADAAFVQFNGRRSCRAEVLGVGPVKSLPMDIKPDSLPVPVILVGACSGQTHGVVVALHFQGRVDYPDGSVMVRDQLCVEPADGGVFSRQGDSGGGVLHDAAFVGLLIAAGDSEAGGVGLVTPMRRVLDGLGVTLAS